MTLITVEEYELATKTNGALGMSREIISSFWKAMETNAFDRAAEWLHPDFEYFMPQTNEYLSGRENFARFNAAYPTEGIWTFKVETIVCGEDTAVSDVLITDGTQDARAVTFHTLKDGLILRQKEFWPDPYAAPAWRSQWMRVLSKAPF